jgi:ubiquinone biosynthesis monooxygenase Coq6
VLTKADPAILTSMINAALRLPEPSVHYLHARLLEIPPSSLSPDDLRAEIAFREHAHAIAPHSALASANGHTGDGDDASIGIPDHGADALPPLVTSIQPGTIASFPLRFRHAESYIGNRTALIGDAAHVIHPLAGQGLNLGLGDAAALARCVRTAVIHGGDIGASILVSLMDSPTNEEFSFYSPRPQAHIRRSFRMLENATLRTTR